MITLNPQSVTEYFLFYFLVGYIVFKIMKRWEVLNILCVGVGELFCKLWFNLFIFTSFKYHSWFNINVWFGWWLLKVPVFKYTRLFVFPNIFPNNFLLSYFNSTFLHFVRLLCRNNYFNYIILLIIIELPQCKPETDLYSFGKFWRIFIWLYIVLLICYLFWIISFCNSSL